MVMVTSRGHHLQYEVVGEGPALVLVHGFMMWGGFWRERGYVDALGEQFMLVLPDLLGHGASDKPTDPAQYAIEAIADDLLVVLDDAKVDRAHLWGYSYGAWVAEAFTIRHPTRVSRLALGGAVPGMASEVRSLWSPAIVDAAARNDWESLLQMFSSDMREQVRARNDIGALGCAASRFGDWGTSPEELAAADVPTLVYGGDAEWFHDSARDAATAAGASFVTMSGNHAAVFGATAQAVAVVRPHLDDTI